MANFELGEDGEDGGCFVGGRQVSRPTLPQLRQALLRELDDTWRSPTDFQWRLGLGGSDWYRVGLVLERLASDGHAELKAKPGSGRRWFRRAAA